MQAGKRIGADLLEFAVPEIAEVIRGSKNFKTAAKNVGRQTLRKVSGSGSRKKLRAESFQQLPQNKSVGRDETFYNYFSLIMSSKFRYQPFMAVSGNPGKSQ